MFESRAVKYVLVVCLGFVSVCVCVCGKVKKFTMKQLSLTINLAVKFI